jgi:hypothetical protein
MVQSRPTPLIVLVLIAAVCAVVVIVGSFNPWLSAKGECEFDCHTKGTELEDSGYLFLPSDDILGIEEGKATIGLAGVGIAAVLLGLAISMRVIPLVIGAVVLLGAGVVAVIDWVSLTMWIGDVEGEDFIKIGWGLQAVASAGILGGILSFVALAVASPRPRATPYGSFQQGYGQQPGYQAGFQQRAAQPNPGANQPVLNDGVWWVRGPDNRWLYWDERTSQWVSPPG